MSPEDEPLHQSEETVLHVSGSGSEVGEITEAERQALASSETQLVSSDSQPLDDQGDDLDDLDEEGSADETEFVRPSGPSAVTVAGVFADELGPGSGPDPAPVRVGSGPRAPAALGERIGRYELREELAAGGMGVVYRAWDSTLDREVALKVQRSFAGDDQEEVRLRFRIEAQAAAQLRHPNVVAVHEAGLEGARLYLVMDLVEGESLQKHLERDGRFPPRRAARLVHALAQALDAAHRQLILHRDLKPANVILTPVGEPLLTDFGLAKHLDRDSLATQDGQFLGTPSFAAPEQAQGEAVDVRTDVYGLGATLYALLAGRAPFTGDTTWKVLVDVQKNEVPSFASLGVELDADLTTICLKCLEKNPAGRYQTARELAEDLGRYLEDRPILARSPGAWGRLRKWTRRNPAAAWASAAALAVSLSGLGIWQLLERRARQRVADIRDYRARLLREAALGPLADSNPGDPPLGLGAALGLVERAQRWREFEPDAPEARATEAKALALLVETARRSEQWDLALHACAQLDELEPGQAAELEAGVKTARDAEALARRAEVEAVLAEARAGAVARPGWLVEAVHRLVRHADEELTDFLAGELDAISAALLEAEREVYLAQAAEGDHEVLTRALSQRARGQPLSTLEQRALRLVEAKLLQSARGVGGTVSGRATVQGLVAGAQLTRVGEPELAVARVISEALGWIGRTGRPRDALIRYLAAEGAADRAVAAGLALCRLGGSEAEAAIQRALERHRREANFTMQIERLMRRLSGGPPEEGQAELEPAGADELAQRGRALLLRGEPRRALECMQQAVQQAAPGSASRAGAYNGLGDACRALGDLTGAEQAYTRSLADVPNQVEAYNQRGLVRLELGDAEGAMGDFSQALALDPSSVQVWSNRGRLRVMVRDVRGALQDFDRAVALQPGMAALRRNRGALRFRLRDYPGAREDFDAALAADPGDVEAYLGRAQVRGQLGDPAGAVADMLKAVEVGPTNGRARFLLARHRYEQGDRDGAWSEVQKAVELEPQLAQGYSLRGRIHADRGELEAAWEDLCRALELRPQDIGAHVWRGDVLLAQGQPQRALADYEQALELWPQNLPVICKRGLARAALGQAAAAREDLERFLAETREADYPAERSQARAALDELLAAEQP